jgi:hypothetical protein
MVADRPSDGRPSPWRGRAGEIGGIALLAAAGIVLLGDAILGTLDQRQGGEALPEPWFAVAATVVILGIWLLALAQRSRR